MIECRRKGLTMMYGSVTYAVPFGVHPMDEAFRDPADETKAHPDSVALSWHAVHKFGDIRLGKKERTWFVRTFVEEAPSAADIVLEGLAEGRPPADYIETDPVLASLRSMH